MSGDVDPMMAELRPLGMRNKEVIALIHAFCTHADVEECGGRGMAEASLGLPLNMRTIRCPYATGGRLEGMNLEVVALDFHANNCVGCPHRSPTGVLPNLETLAGSHNEQAEAAAIAAKEVSDAAEVDRLARADARSRRRLGEAYTVADQLDHVDRLDGPTGVPDSDAVEWLRETAKLRPDVVAETTVGALVELANTDSGAPTAVRAAATGVLALLVNGSKFPAEEAVELAVASLALGPSQEAAELLSACAGELKRRHLAAPVIRSVIELGGRDHDPWERAASRWSQRPVVSDPGPLLACVRVDDHLVTDTLVEMINRRTHGQRASGLLDRYGAPLVTDSVENRKLDDRWCSVAAGAALVVAKAEPSSRRALIRALGGALDQPDWDRYDAPPSDVISQVLAQLLAYCPDDVVPELHALAQSLSAEGRRRLFRVVTQASRQVEENTAAETVKDVTDLVIGRLGGDWGDEIASDAAVALDDLARWRPTLLLGHAAALVGALVEGAADGDAPAADLSVVQDPMIAGLEEMGRRLARQTTINRLGAAVGRLVRAGADDAADAVLNTLDCEDDGTEQAVKVRAELVELLGEIGAVPSQTDRALRPLYSGLLHTDFRVRSAAVRAWEKLARETQPLPSTLVNLIPALLADGYVAVIAATLTAMPALDVSDEEIVEIVKQISKLAGLVHASHPDWAEKVIGPAIGALRSASRQLDLEAAVTALGVAVYTSDLLSPLHRRRVLGQSWPTQIANSGIFALRCLELLADPALVDDFDERDTSLEVALLECPYGVAMQPMELFYLVGALELPDNPWPALEMVELLQRAGRFADASAFAEWVTTCVPETPSHAGNRSLVVAVAAVAAAEATGTARPTFPLQSVDDHPKLGELVRRAEAIAEARRLLQESAIAAPHAKLRERADRLFSLAESISSADSQSEALASELALQIWAAAVRAVASLLTWDAAIQQGTETPEQHRARAIRISEVAQANGGPAGTHDVLFGPLLSVLEAVTSVDSPNATGSVATQLAAVPIPIRLITPARQTVQSWNRPEPEPAPPLAVAVFRLDGALVTNAHVVRPDERHDLTIEMSLTDWPDGADALELSFLSVLGGHQVQLPSFSVPRPTTDAEGVYNITTTGRVSISFSLPPGAAPEAFPLAARFTGPGMDQVVRVAGHSELRLRPFDASTDGLTDRPQLDARLVEMFANLHGMDLDPEDVQSFCRLFSAIAAAGADIQFDVAYKRGARVQERTFHDDLHKRLSEDTTLEGRVRRGTPTAGGFLDVQHDRINAELKVARDKVVTVEGSHRYLGQPTDYASDLGAQLSVLVVLEMTQKQAPPGVLENYVGWMKPQLHGLDDPRYPSLVGVIIINGNLPTPSSFSRRKIAAMPYPPLANGDHEDEALRATESATDQEQAPS